MADIFVTTGENLVTDILDGVRAPTPTWHIEWGLGSTTAVKGDTAIETTSSEARVVASMSQPSANINRWLGTITAAGARTITEVGVFDLLTAGIMLMRSDFGGIVLALNDKIEFTIDGTHS